MSSALTSGDGSLLARQAELARILVESAHRELEADESAPDNAVTLLDEARALVDEALPHASEGTDLRRSLTVTLAFITLGEGWIRDDPAAVEDAIVLFESALAPRADSLPEDDRNPELWNDGLAYEARDRLVGLLANACESEVGPESARDRMIHHLELLLDNPVDSAAQEAANRQVELGLVLADRSRGIDALMPSSVADRERAMSLLRAALDNGVLDQQATEDARIDLAQLLFVQAAATDDGDGEAPIPSTLVDEILDLLDPVLRNDEAIGRPYAFTIAVSVAANVCVHAPTAENRQALVDCSRRALEIDDTEARDVADYRLLIAEQILDRADGEWPESSSAPGAALGPEPARDEAEALGLCEQILESRPEIAEADASENDPSGPSVEAYLVALDLAIVIMGRTSVLAMSDGRLDVYIDYCDRLTRADPTVELNRDSLYTRLGNALCERGRRAVGHLQNMPMHDAFAQAMDPSATMHTMVQHAPEADDDFGRAIGLLRAAIDLCPAGSDGYFAAVVPLATVLLLRYVIHVPSGDRTLIQQGIQWMRVALEAAPDADVDYLAPARRLLIFSLVQDLWRTGPFTRFVTSSEDWSLTPDPSAVPSVEEDVRLLEDLIQIDVDSVRRHTAPPEPSVLFVSAILAYIRGPSGRGEFLDRLRGVLEFEQDFAEGEQWIPMYARLNLASDSSSPTLPPEAAEYARRWARLMASATGHDDLSGLLRRSMTSGPVRAQMQWILDPAGTDDPSIPDPAPAALAEARTPGATSEPLPAKARQNSIVVDGNATLDVDPRAAVLVGDGSPFPFTQPIGHVFEVLDDAENGKPLVGGSPLRHVLPVVRAMALYDRWLRERDPGDFAAAVELARHGARAVADERSPLGARIAAFVSGVLLDRYSLLGDRADLEAATRGYARLLDRSVRGSHVPPLSELLARHCDSAHAPQISAMLLHTTPPTESGGRDWSSGVFAAEVLAALGWAELSGARRDVERRKAVGRLERARAELPRGHPRSFAVLCELACVEAERAASADDRIAFDAAVGRALDSVADCPVENPHRPALLLRVAALLGEYVTAARLGSAERAAELLDHGIALLDEAANTNAHRYLGARARCRYGLGRLLHMRALRTGSVVDLDAAVAVLRYVWAVADPAPGDPFGILVRRALAEAYRDYGQDDAVNRRLSRDAGAAVLGQQREAVLLQSGTRHGLDSARRAEQDMMRLVHWCIDDGEWAGAVQALERGRGLVLNAVTVAASVPSRLSAVGREDLAERWAEARTPAVSPDAPDADASDAAGLLTIPDDLRREAFQVLEGTDDEQYVLSVPDVDDIGAALRKVGADAFVYLIAGGPSESGYALIVRQKSSGGPGDSRSGYVIDPVELPDLLVEPGGALQQYVSVLAERHSNSAAPAPLPDIGTQRSEASRDAHAFGTATTLTADEVWERRLESLCFWAADAAMDKVLDHMRGLVRGRAPRLVLASAGMLGLVPWHAARLTLRGGAERRMCQEAVVSYCATARQFADAAARPQPSVDGVKAMIVDPHGSGQMHLEARIIRDAFYPDCVVVGGPANAETDATGGSSNPLTHAATSAKNVLSLLPGRGRSSASLLIANCHAAVGVTAADSLLVIDSGRPQVAVTVEQLLSGAHRRDPAAPGGLMVLVDCNSDLALVQHDESVTLTTALLAAGAGAVIGARWLVDDDDSTTALMFMFHHFLNGGGAPHAREAAGSPVDALRAAQCWMLDPQRQFPKTPKGDILARRLRDGAASKTRAWAAFAHHGR